MPIGSRLVMGPSVLLAAGVLPISTNAVTRGVPCLGAEQICFYIKSTEAGVGLTAIATEFSYDPAGSLASYYAGEGFASGGTVTGVAYDVIPRFWRAGPNTNATPYPLVLDCHFVRLKYSSTATINGFEIQVAIIGASEASTPINRFGL